ncbi:transposase IS4 domain-containing protein [Ditylenchus destructor]|uniref:Transposase IS4 domain-containing protein n=1 Tax=Ditylenchus destructor TaxID=166010 RepID=A0AAD4NBP1_9BILA|nr:transposase IS4 domain-containing protein [Ditylenchus destructor]
MMESSSIGSHNLDTTGYTCWLRFLNYFLRPPQIFPNMAHFRKTMNVEQALEYLEELDLDDAIVGADVFLEPPTNENVSDEDSADEDIGGNMDNLNRNQLLANAELRVQAREGHLDDLFEEDNAAPTDVDPPGPLTYPPLPTQLKWSKRGSFADLNAGDIDNAHLDQLTYHTPVQMFELFFSDDLYNMMKVQSELYAISLHKKFTVTIDELKAFIGIMLLSGYMDLPKWRMMWEQGSETHVPMVSEAMRRNRFEEIKRYLHFNENANLDITDKFSKVRPLLDHVNARYKEYAVLERKLAVDER